ncbi:D-arabinono-1,4-lactone oxidase [Tsuneonella mangrovi]|uniref:D-arabinono-1,4-lactone oxidase n=1 Tax=Tsuneonella mangrovi TaxID=1982042 RepID=UPI000BA267CD|nr:D-arabinono-1,4-lactone oxidase [Tsuneonella mangrovi]
MTAWHNWSGSVSAAPGRIAEPRDEAELAQIVAESAKVRVTGAGHSFMPLCETDGTLLRLDRMEGAIKVEPDRQSAWIPAGMSIAKATEQLWDMGLSLANQGDVNPQSIAGAVGTGTHGTGITLGSLSSQVTGMRLVKPNGEVTTCDADARPDLFNAARLSLGMVGVASAVRMKVLPAYHLSEKIEKKSLGEVLEAWDELVAAHRHIEFWVFPWADKVLLKTLDLAEPDGPYVHRPDVDETAFRVACNIAKALPFAIPVLQKAMTLAVSDEPPRTGPAWRIFPQDRTVRFEEMEYEIPYANGIDALKAAIAHVRKHRLPFAFPFEFRTVAGDDIWLSPFHAGPCISLSVHQYAPMAWQHIFAELEAVLRDHGARPHWGKRHTLGPDDVHALYPDAARFLAVRQQVDPAGKFVNASCARVFGIDTPGA